jgi:protein-S-isoprenylcysteine O-methyltransferase Ste14
VGSNAGGHRDNDRGTRVGVFVVRRRGTPALFDAPRVFVAVGPYRHVRNPMYVGGFTMFVDLSLCERSISILIFGFAWAVFRPPFRALPRRTWLTEKVWSQPRWIPEWY